MNDMNRMRIGARTWELILTAGSAIAFRWKLAMLAAAAALALTVQATGAALRGNTRRVAVRLRKTEDRGNTLIGLVAASGIALAVIVATVWGGNPNASAATATPTPYHEGFPSPAASPSAGGHSFPLPAAQDLDTANSMTAAGIAMVEAAQGMADASVALAASGNPELVTLSSHWAADARALYDRGVWMIATVSSAGMVHDSDKAKELDVANLQVNGQVMEAEGQAMVVHGQEMADQVQQLRDAGSLDASIADPLITAGKDLVDAGRRMAKEGKKMQDTAESLLTSLGK